MDMNFCRRCGQPLTRDHDHVYRCENGHVIFANASPAVSLVLVNDKREALIAVRAMDPGKGKFDIAGGFADGAESAEAGLAREIIEEVGLSPHDYGEPEFVLTYIDPYDYKGETIPVLSLMFWASIKPDAAIRAADDVAEVMFMKYADIEPDKFHFPSGPATLKRMHELGII